MKKPRLYGKVVDGKIVVVDLVQWAEAYNKAHALAEPRSLKNGRQVSKVPVSSGNRWTGPK